MLPPSTLEKSGRSRLAARLALGKPAISAAVEALPRRGFLVRSAANGDERASALSLTAEGRAALSRAEAEMTRRPGARYRAVNSS
jgi:DNA-binding MarR family transcriptional regulator